MSYDPTAQENILRSIARAEKHRLRAEDEVRVLRLIAMQHGYNVAQIDSCIQEGFDEYCDELHTVER